MRRYAFLLGWSTLMLLISAIALANGGTLPVRASASHVVWWAVFTVLWSVLLCASTEKNDG